jgi:DNA modification methylase
MELTEGLIKGCHWTVYKGNCLDALKDIMKDSIDCIVTSPPYYNKRSYGKKPKRDGNIADWLYANRGHPIEGEIGNSKSILKYLSDIRSVLELCYEIIKPNKLIFINISTSHNKLECIDLSHDFIKIAKEVGFNHWDTIIWIKRNPMPPGRHKGTYLGQGWEYILAFSKGKDVKINDQDIKINTHFKCENCGCDNYITSKITPNYLFCNIGCYGRNYTKFINHPAVFPRDLPAYCLSIATKQGDLILDPFVGSGTTLIAGLEQGLNVIGCELVPEIYEELIKGMKNLN